MDFIIESNRIYLPGSDEQILAEVTFPDMDTTTVNINHTYVSDTLRGQGIAGLLMEALVKQLRVQQKKAVLTCSYAVKWFQNHPEASDVVK